ncbi:MAG: FecR domain-containing protein [Bradyrhizobium sp.]|nr:FecR domain-containing protein [Bradyrhizobium sp.]
MADGPTQRNDRREQIEDEAAVWFLRLSENPDDPGLNEQIALWRGQSEAHREIWNRTRDAYDVLGKTVPIYETRWAALASVRELRPPKARSSRKLRFFSAAAGAMLAACIALVTLPGLLVRLHADYTTKTAEVRALELEDGSLVHLAPRSAVDVVFDDRERKVHLISGQAFFEVRRDASRPFIVDSDGILTTVLGTKFEVRLETEGVSVAVREGHVRVADMRRNKGGTRDLAAGDMLHLGAAATPTLTATPASDIGDWSEGRLVARHRPVSEIVDRLRSYYGGVILMSDTAFSRLEVSGVYDPKKPIQTLDSLTRLHGATMRQISPWLVLVTPF